MKGCTHIVVDVLAGTNVTIRIRRPGQPLGIVILSDFSQKPGCFPPASMCSLPTSYTWVATSKERATIAFTQLATCTNTPAKGERRSTVKRSLVANPSELREEERTEAAWTSLTKEPIQFRQIPAFDVQSILRNLPKEWQLSEDGWTLTKVDLLGMLKGDCFTHDTVSACIHLTANTFGCRSPSTKHNDSRLDIKFCRSNELYTGIWCIPDRIEDVNHLMKGHRGNTTCIAIVRFNTPDPTRPKIVGHWWLDVFDFSDPNLPRILRGDTQPILPDDMREVVRFGSIFRLAYLMPAVRPVATLPPALALARTAEWKTTGMSIGDQTDNTTC